MWQIKAVYQETTLCRDGWDCMRLAIRLGRFTLIILTEFVRRPIFIRTEQVSQISITWIKENSKTCLRSYKIAGLV